MVVGQGNLAGAWILSLCVAADLRFRGSVFMLFPLSPTSVGLLFASRLGGFLSLCR